MGTPRSEGLIYFALDATRHQQYVKIGYTVNLRRRMGDLSLSASSGQTPIVLALESGGVSAERERHRQFASLRSHGEWFRYEGDLLKLLVEMEHPFSYLLDRPHLWRFAPGWGPLGSSPAPIYRADGEGQACLDDDEGTPAAYPTKPLKPGHYINDEGVEVGPDGLVPIDF